MNEDASNGRPPEVTSDVDRLVYTVRETAQALRISENTCYELLRRGVIPSVKLGAQYRIPAWSLKVWISRESGAPLPDETPSTSGPKEH